MARPSNSPAVPVNFLLFAILALAIALRLPAIDFGLPGLYDPDEPIFMLAALKLLNGPTLNPGWFGHPGTTTIYSLGVIDLGVLGFGRLTGHFADSQAFARAIYADPGVVVLPGRFFILACGIVCVFLTYLIGKRVFGPAVGLVAAMMLATDPLHVRYSQIIRTDMHATVFVLLCVLAAIAIVRRGRLSNYLWASAAAAFACATKWPTAAVVVVIIGACVTRMIDHPDERRRQARYLTLAATAAPLALFVASPYLFLDYHTVLSNLTGEVQHHHLGATGQGFFGNIAWYVGDPMRYALGLAGLALGTVGAVIAVHESSIFRATLAPVMLVLFGLLAAQSMIWARWIVPLLPFLSIVAALAIVRIAQWVQARLGRRYGMAVGAGALLAVVVPTLIATRADAVERQNDTRRLAVVWARKHIPTGSTVIVEHFALDMLGHGWRFLYPLGNAGCVDVAANLARKIPYSTIEKWRGGRAIVDIGTIDPARFATCRADYAIFVDYDRYVAEAADYPQEIAVYRRMIDKGRIVQTIAPMPGEVGGPIVRIVQMTP